MTFFAAYARDIGECIILSSIAIYALYYNIGIWSYMVAGPGSVVQTACRRRARLHPFFNKSRSNADHSRLIYIHVKTSIECTTIYQVLFDSFADYLSHTTDDWLTCILTITCVLQTRVGPVKKSKQIAYYTIEIESLIRIVNILFIEFCHSVK